MKITIQSKMGLVLLCGAIVLVFGCGGGGGGGKTSTTTASATTSATTTATATGTIYSSNEIVYGVANAAVNPTTFSVAQIKPDGTGNSALISGIPTTVYLFAQVPGSSKQFISASALTASTPNIGIYVSTNLSTTTTTTLVAPTYTQVNSLAVTANGAYIVYTANPASDPTGGSNLYILPIKGGTPVNLGQSDGAVVSPVDSNTIYYVALSGSFDQVFSRSLSAGAGGSATQLTSDSVSHSLPAVNRTGTQIAYWEESSSANSLLVQTLSGNATVALPNPNSLSPYGESFSADGTQVAIVADASGSGQILTQSIAGGAAPTAILSNSTLEVGLYGVYWTDSNGRGLVSSIIPSAVRRRQGLAYFLRH